jgi:hypothetical protein
MGQYSPQSVRNSDSSPLFAFSKTIQMEEGCYPLSQDLCGEQLNGFPVRMLMSTFSSYLKQVSEPATVSNMFENDYGWYILSKH